MKVAVLPEGSVLLSNLVYKNGHELLQMYPITPESVREKDYKDDDELIDPDSPLYKLTGNKVVSGNKYVSSEVPSGIKGRLTLASHIIEEAEAAIILARAPKDRQRMWGELNEAILLYFGVGTGNFPKFILYLLRHKNIPRLELKYPENQEELIELFSKVNTFLKNLETYPKDYISNDDNITTDGVPYKSKLPYVEFEQIVHQIND